MAYCWRRRLQTATGITRHRSPSGDSSYRGKDSRYKHEAQASEFSTHRDTLAPRVVLVLCGHIARVPLAWPVLTVD